LIEHIRTGLAGHEPVRLADEHYERLRAAVLVPLIPGDEPRLILTERSGALDTHGGEVAFPGGRQDDTDAGDIMTALRETHEEIGVPPDAVEVLGFLRPFISKYGLLVTPVVGVVRPDVVYDPNPGEIASIFEVPLNYFDRAVPVRHDDITRHGESNQVPAWDFEGYEIWGLTSLIIDEFLRVIDVV
jgi:8-oxo-dGTP pyrophosphatase MutT (NUDIX family)